MTCVEPLLFSRTEVNAVQVLWYLRLVFQTRRMMQVNDVVGKGYYSPMITEDQALWARRVGSGAGGNLVYNMHHSRPQSVDEWTWI